MNIPAPQRHTGLVLWCRPDRGHGRIARDQAEPLYFHVKHMREKGNAPNTNDLVEYTLAAPQHTHEPMAVDIVILNS